MSSLEQLGNGYTHPEGFSRPRAMRDEMGPIVTLLSLRTLDLAEAQLDERGEMLPEYTLSYRVEAVSEYIKNTCAHILESELALDSELLHSLPILNEHYHTPDDSMLHRVMYYAYYAYSQKTEALRIHIEDGFGPQMTLTNNLLLPGFLHAKDPSKSVDELSNAQIADILEDPEFEALLVATTKTANGLWSNGKGDDDVIIYRCNDILLSSNWETLRGKETGKKYAAKLQDLYDEYYSHTRGAAKPTGPEKMGITPENLCVVNDKGNVVISPFVRTYLRLYIQFKNELSIELEDFYKADIRVAHTEASAGCPVSIRSGKFPLHLIPREALAEQFAGEPQEDGSIVIPGAMTISPEGDYKYTDTSPAILRLNKLFAKLIRTKAPDIPELHPDHLESHVA